MNMCLLVALHESNFLVLHLVGLPLGCSPGVPIEVFYLEHSSAVDKFAVCSLPLWINGPTELRYSLRRDSDPMLMNQYREQCLPCRLTFSAELSSTSGKDCYANFSTSTDFLLS
ncbi:hypothetical protein BT93_L4970 [Corymbia citriodora subsp. variegata]|uniref:Secreted protein n=1 Tax=Corymbia citriodora subsp. variegata TaxID=360336 RepID=A0A8T0CTI2_CORYI|nr:hypothetical protein BT93_L4970 [Corymbia citriodora subsp. variegata]